MNAPVVIDYDEFVSGSDPLAGGMPAHATNEPTNYVAWAKQSAKDTEGTTFFFAKHLSGSGFDPKQNIQAEREGGDGQEVALRWKSLITGDGQIVVNERPEVGARLFAGVLGQDLSQATAVMGATNFWDHTIVPVASLPYYTVEQRFADEVERTTNDQFTSLDLEWEAGRPFKITAGWVNGGSLYQRDVASALVPARETLKPLFYPGASVSLGGAGNTKITKGKIQVKRAVDTNIQTTGLNREDVVALNFDVDVDMTLKYEDRTLYNQVAYQGGSQISIPFLATSALSLAAVNVSSQMFNVNLPLLELIDATVVKLDPDGKTMYVDVVAATVKSASYPIFAVFRTLDSAAY